MYSMPHDPAVILVIDEDVLTLMGVAATLDVCGYECHCARDAEAALKAARNLQLDLIICDTNVDDERGLELCQELRREPGNEDVPVLFVSTGQAPDVIRRKHDVGGTYYLRKPVDPDVLIELVGKALWMPHLVRARTTQSVSPPPPHHAVPGTAAHSLAQHRREEASNRHRGVLASE
jgi:CheY-like chemotaxis protein